MDHTIGRHAQDPIAIAEPAWSTGDLTRAMVTNTPAVRFVVVPAPDDPNPADTARRLVDLIDIGSAHTAVVTVEPGVDALKEIDHPDKGLRTIDRDLVSFARPPIAIPAHLARVLDARITTPWDAVLASGVRIIAVDAALNRVGTT